MRDEVTLITLGDSNGDGMVGILDYTLTRFDILNLQSLTGLFVSAADIDGNGLIDISDYTLLRFHILNIKPITGHGPELPAITDPRIAAYVEIAIAQLGDPYVWGAEGPDSFDCSGFVYYCLSNSGYNDYTAPQPTHTASGQQWEYVEKEDLQPGDLMFYFSDPYDPNRPIGHIGIYLGNGYHIHASSTYGCIMIARFDGWYAQQFSHGRRVYSD